MSCGCKTSGDSGHSCGTKSASGCESVDTCGNSYKLSVFDWLSNVSSPSEKTEDTYVEVRFKNDRKSFYKNVHSLPLHIGAIITVEASPGHDVGVVSLTGELVKIQMKRKRFNPEHALKIYRIANQKDVETWQEARKKEDGLKTQAKIIASRLGLEMKITDVEFQGDAAKATFYYTADNRVDFRQLIKEYAATFRTKIDMKQIGFRQEAAKIGGIGSCGRELCCSSWLTDFRSVNTNAARYQQLSINPQKLAGQCGKLKCCLNFELDSYLDALNDFPSSSTTLDTEKGKAFCIKIDVFKKKMWFAYQDNPVAWYDVETEKVKEQIQRNKKGQKALLLEDLVSKDLVPQKPVDLIGENNPDRFERKNRNKGKSPQRKPLNKGGRTTVDEKGQSAEPKKDFRKKGNRPSGQKNNPSQPNNKSMDKKEGARERRPQKSSPNTAEKPRNTRSNKPANKNNNQNNE